MTRQEAIEVFKKTLVYESELAEAKQMAIEALEKEPSEDCISREYVLDKLNEQYKVNRFEEHNDMANIGINQAESIVQDAPSVVPSRAEGKWIIVEYEYFTCDQCGGDVLSGAESTREARNMLENGEYPNFCPDCGAKMKGYKNE